MSIDYKSLNLLLQELSELSNKDPWDKRDEKRNAYLLSAVSAVKAGASLRDLEERNLNEVERANGLDVTKFKKSSLTREQETEARGWQAFAKYGKTTASREQRDMVEGAPMINHIGTYSSLGFFVPDGFWNDVMMTMKQADVLFNPDWCTFLRTETGAPMTLPLLSDTENAQAVNSEAGTQTSTDFSSTEQAVLGSYAWNSKRIAVSLEAFDDLQGTLSTIALFKKVVAGRLARGIGQALVKGSGSGTTLGLIPSLQEAGAPIVIAAGSSANDGGASTGAGAIGAQDYANCIAQLDPAYLNSSKVAFLMNMSTFVAALKLTDKMGRPLIDFVDGARQIYGIPIQICPSLDSIGASNIPVVLGACDYWATRFVFDDTTGIKIYREAPGLIEAGKIGLGCFARADGALLYDDQSAPSPFVLLMNHS